MSYGLRERDGRTVELCDECGFDGQAVRQLAETIAAAADELAGLATRPGADRRPAPETWSAAEYAAHCVQGSDALVAQALLALGRPAPEPAPDLAAAGALAAEVVRALTDAELATPAEVGPARGDVRGVLLHLAHELQHHLLDSRRGLAALALTEGEDLHTVRR